MPKHDAADPSAMVSVVWADARWCVIASKQTATVLELIMT
jgi:hypothetical protein